MEMKIKLLKDLPFAKAGTIFEILGNGQAFVDLNNPGSIITTGYKKGLLDVFKFDKEWFTVVEEVKEETLEEKLHKNCIDVRQIGYIANIATEHFMERFDKKRARSLLDYQSSSKLALDIIREELFK